MGLFDGFLDNFNIFFNNDDDENLELENQDEKESDIIGYCEMCGQPIEENEWYMSTVDNGYACADCEDYYVECEKCGYYLRKESANQYPDPNYTIEENKLYNTYFYMCKDCDPNEWDLCDFDGNYEWDDDYEDE